MNLITNLMIGLVAVLHLYFLVLEMFLWTQPYGLRVFGNSLKNAQSTATFAANQGLYNGFLSAGLIWGLLHPVAAFALQIQIFFLSCVIAAGIYGALSVNKKIFWIQALPSF